MNREEKRRRRALIEQKSEERKLPPFPKKPTLGGLSFNANYTPSYQRFKESKILSSNEGQKPSKQFGYKTKTDEQIKSDNIYVNGDWNSPYNSIELPTEPQEVEYAEITEEPEF